MYSSSSAPSADQDPRGLSVLTKISRHKSPRTQLCTKWSGYIMPAVNGAAISQLCRLFVSQLFEDPAIKDEEEAKIMSSNASHGTL